MEILFCRILMDSDDVCHEQLGFGEFQQNAAVRWVGEEENFDPGLIREQTEQNNVDSHNTEDIFPVDCRKV